MSPDKASSKQTFQCAECTRVFTKKCHLLLHLRSHTGERPHVCPSCGKAFSQKGDLTRHVRLHTGEKPYKCDKCIRAFSHKSNLRQHLRLHSGERPYQCDLCGKCFSRRSILNQHQRLHSGVKPYECHHCRKSFPRKGGLIQHIRQHTGEWPFTCEKCNKGFSDKSHLICHMRVHSGEKPFKCKYCDKAFADKSNLNRHVKTHTRAENKCFKCGMPYEDSSYVNPQQPIHHVCQAENSSSEQGTPSFPNILPTNNSLFKCEHCQKEFSLKSNLTKHIRLHTGEKPYSCVYCKKSFSHKSNLTRHTKMHISAKLYNCKTCGIVFFNKGSLIQHNHIRHGKRNKHILSKLPYNEMSQGSISTNVSDDKDLKKLLSLSREEKQPILQSVKNGDAMPTRMDLFPTNLTEKDAVIRKECVDLRVKTLSTMDNSTSLVSEDKIGRSLDVNLPVSSFSQGLQEKRTSELIMRYPVLKTQNSTKHPFLLKSPRNSLCSFGMDCPNHNSHLIHNDNRTLRKQKSFGTDTNHVCQTKQTTVSCATNFTNNTDNHLGLQGKPGAAEFRENPPAVRYVGKNECIADPHSTSNLYVQSEVQYSTHRTKFHENFQRKPHKYTADQHFGNSCSRHNFNLTNDRTALCGQQNFSGNYLETDVFKGHVKMEDHYNKDQNSYIHKTHRPHQSTQNMMNGIYQCPIDQSSLEKFDAYKSAFTKVYTHNVPQHCGMASHISSSRDYPCIFPWSTQKNNAAPKDSRSAIQYVMRWIAHAYARQKLLLNQGISQSKFENNDRNFQSELPDTLKSNRNTLHKTNLLFQNKSSCNEIFSHKQELQYSGWLKYGGYLKKEEDVIAKSEIEVSNEFAEENGLY